MSVGVLELVLAIALIAAGVLQQRKRLRDGSRRGSQAAVIMFGIAAILLIHALSGVVFPA